MSILPADVLPVVLHNHIDKVVDRSYNGPQLVIWSSCYIGAPHTILISHEYLAVENFVIAEHVVNQLFIQMLWGSRKRDLHATGLFDFQVDITGIVSVIGSAQNFVYSMTYGGSLFNRMPTASSSASSKARCSARLVASRIIKIRSLV